MRFLIDWSFPSKVPVQPVFPVYCEWTECILAESVGKAAAAAFQIGLCCITPVENIIHRFIHPDVPNWLLLIEPRLLPVKGKPIGILLIHSPCNSGCRDRTFPNQSRRNLRLYDHGFSVLRVLPCRMGIRNSGCSIRLLYRYQE